MIHKFEFIISPFSKNTVGKKTIQENTELTESPAIAPGLPASFSAVISFITG